MPRDALRAGNGAVGKADTLRVNVQSMLMGRKLKPGEDLPSWIHAARYGKFSSTDSGGGFCGFGIASVSSCCRCRNVFGLLMMWKHVTTLAIFVVSIPAPTMLIASSLRRGTSRSSRGKSEFPNS